MVGRLTKAAAVLAILIGLAIVGQFGWSKYVGWRVERAIDAALAVNESHWKTGEGMRVAARMVARIDGEERVWDSTLDCFRRQVVDRDSRGLPVTLMVTDAVALESLFTLFGKDRAYRIGPASAFCAEMLDQSTAPELPRAFEGEIVIDAIPPEDGQIEAMIRMHVGPACRLTWKGDQPINLGDNMHIDLVELTTVENLPVRDMVREPGHMGPVDMLITRLAPGLLGNVLNNPARYTWNNERKCWLSDRDTACDTRADVLCGIPSL